MMKLLMALCALTFSSLTWACADFSGSYTFTDGQDAEQYQIIQNQCSSITLASSSMSTVTVADGAYHVVHQEDIVMNGEKLGRWSIERRARFGTSELFLDSKYHLEFAGEVDDEEIISVKTLLPNGDLKSVETSSKDGVAKTIIAKRVR